MPNRALLTYLGFGLGTIMILAGVASIFSSSPRPELATAGVTLVLATGLVGTTNGNGRRK